MARATTESAADPLPVAAAKRDRRQYEYGHGAIVVWHRLFRLSQSTAAPSEFEYVNVNNSYRRVHRSSSSSIGTAANDDAVVVVNNTDGDHDVPAPPIPTDLP